MAFEEFTSKKFELQHATVQKVDGKQVILDLGGKAQALLVGEDQVTTERWAYAQGFASLQTSRVVGLTESEIRGLPHNCRHKIRMVFPCL